MRNVGRPRRANTLLRGLRPATRRHQIGPRHQRPRNQRVKRHVHGPKRQRVGRRRVCPRFQPHNQTQPVRRVPDPVGGDDLLFPELRNPHPRRQHVRQGRRLLPVTGLCGCRVGPRRLQRLLHRLQRRPRQHHPPVGLRRVKPHLILPARQIALCRRHPKRRLPPPVNRLPTVENRLQDLQLGLEIGNGLRAVQRVHVKIRLREPLLPQPESEGVHRVVGPHHPFGQPDGRQMPGQRLKLHRLRAFHPLARRPQHLIALHRYGLRLRKRQRHRPFGPHRRPQQ